MREHAPNLPRGTEVHSPQISQNTVGKIGIAIPMQLTACFRVTVKHGST